MNNRVLIDIFVRYILVFIFGLGNLFIFYFLLTPITINAIYFILGLFGNVVLESGVFYFNGFDFNLIEACVAASAYYLLFVLIMIVKDLNWKKRVFMILSGFGMLFILNIVRILVLVGMYWSVYFDAVHWWLWHVFSILFVVGIWFLLIKLFNVKSTPFWDDFKFIKSLKN